MNFNSDLKVYYYNLKPMFLRLVKFIYKKIKMKKMLTKRQKKIID